MNGESVLHCDEVIGQLWAYIDEELTTDRAAQIRAHLEMCERCYPQYNFHRTFVTFMTTVGNKSLPRGVRRRVFQRLLEEDAGGALA
jgi:anti-sigma factor (TIGR02949 family)